MQLTVRFWPIPTSLDKPLNGGFEANHLLFAIYFVLSGIADAR